MTRWTKKEAPVEQPDHEPELSAYQQAMRKRRLAARVLPAPEPWQRIAYVPVGGLPGIGFASHPVIGHDLVMAVSHDGHGLFDAVTGEKIVRDRDPDPEDSTPDAVADLSCPWLGPVSGGRVRTAGLFGEGFTPPPRTAGHGRSSARPGRMTVSCSPPTAACPTRVPTESGGGTSSAPATPNSAHSVSRRPGRPSLWRRAVISHCGHAGRTTDTSAAPKPDRTRPRVESDGDRHGVTRNNP